MLSLISSIVRTLRHFLILFFGAYTVDRLRYLLHARCIGLILPPNSDELCSLQLHFAGSKEMQFSHWEEVKVLIVFFPSIHFKIIHYL